MRLSLANRQATFWVYLLTFIFIGINALLIAGEFFYFSMVPLALAVALVAIYALDKLVYLAVFATPLSIQLSDLVNGMDFDLSLPSEPLILGIMLIFLLKYLFEGKFDRRVMRHPVTIAIGLNLAWMLLTSVTSTMPLVSFKFLISRIWFIVAFYLLATQIFRRLDNIKVFTWMYIIPFLVVIAYAWHLLSGYGFLNQQAAHWVVQPFYNDHTSYGAMLAMIIPVLIAMVLIQGKVDLLRQIILWTVLGIFLLAILFSYTRAAWVSLAGALFIFLVIRFRVKFVYLALAGVVGLAVLYSYRTEIRIQLEQNRQVSSEDLVEHVKSISNVATDVSNMERLNRWSCAWRMFKEKPVFGWGPGTYMFQYAPFQLEREKTEISTNAADLGNAHSEYIGPLTESGILGTLTFLGIVIVTILTGLRCWRLGKDRVTRVLSLGLLLGLITYYLHGLLNNFLDTDKASVIFWGFTAALVSIDLYHRRDAESSGTES